MFILFKTISPKFDFFILKKIIKIFIFVFHYCKIEILNKQIRNYFN
jgi:hypothetical protein